MKRILLVLTLVLALGIGTMVVFAETNKSETRLPGFTHVNMTEAERQEWFNERNQYRNEYRQESLKKALEDGTITEAQAKEWEEHFKYEDDFHHKNGFIDGGCGRGNGMMGNMMRGNSNGRMMRGNRF